MLVWYHVVMKSSKELANVILAIVDDEKRYVQTEDDDERGTVRELRMQLREVAFALIADKEVKTSDLS